ncbi:Peptidase S54, rhomboid domain [Dillenia turbinata]|uniref:Peptidase S54, rhomboid domain n=1 Tax=Dillenia turbinata TaxID=194707 RepID=A0AAN8UP29_9MAGN
MEGYQKMLVSVLISQAFMAVVPVCYKISYKDPNLPNSKVMRQSEGGFIGDFITIQDGVGCCSSTCSYTGRIMRKSIDVYSSKASIPVADIPILPWAHSIESYSRSRFGDVPQKRRSHKIFCVSESESNANERQLKSLDSYFGKLQKNPNQPSCVSSNKKPEFDNYGELEVKKGLLSLNEYFSKLDASSKKLASSTQTDESEKVAEPFSIREDSERSGKRKLKSYMERRKRDAENGRRSSQVPQQFDETSGLYLISILASINIAVFLFEIATPISNSDFELVSIPLLYGAKINHLILVGEWWRLVTPMFLHSGLLHVALGCWVLLTFGPQVCRGYGSFTFFLIYILGGISGNLTSFLHTAELTVCGTDVIAKDISESMFQKAILATAFSLILSHFGPIDDWTHFGAAFTGIVYGFFACPTLQLDDASSKTGQEDGITLIGRYADPCKSLIVFTIFAIVFSLLLFFVEPPLNSL